jgi:AraC-like DNA-binding protein
LPSRSELCRCFRRMLGMPPKEFLMQYRIQQAEILLKNSAYSIAEVAEFTGFSSPSHFGSCFLRYVGCTPREYRKSL